jgi:hypothetical protein
MAGHLMTGSPKTSLARLAFWSRNMVAIKDDGMDWPGFSYSEAEWRRMRELAEPVADSTFRRFIITTAVLFLLIAAAGIVGIFLPLANLLFPVPAETGALQFAVLLAACCLLIIGAGVPLSMSGASRLCADARMHGRLTSQPDDDALASKIRWQIGRITLVMCGLLVPGMLLLISYDIDGGPLLSALKWLGAIIVVLSAAGLRQGGKRGRGGHGDVDG